MQFTFPIKIMLSRPDFGRLLLPDRRESTFLFYSPDGRFGIDAKKSSKRKCRPFLKAPRKKGLALRCGCGGIRTTSPFGYSSLLKEEMRREALTIVP